MENIDIDIDVSRWILEFLFRQPIDDRALNALVGVLPLSDDHPTLKKTMLLRRIELEIKTDPKSEKILELLEIIEQMDYEEGIRVPATMKAAYCAVAVDCTVRHLGDSREEEEEEWEFFEAVKRIWRQRVGKMEKLESLGLGFVSEELWSWRDKVEAAIWDVNVRERLRKRKEGNEAVEAVRVYVAEARESLGPPFLELVVETLGYDTLKELLGCDNVWERVTSLEDSVGNTNGEKETRKDKSSRKRKRVRGRNSRGAILETARGVHISDNVESGLGALQNKYDAPPTVKVNKVQEELRSSSLQLQAMVEDPLPDAVKRAADILSKMRSEITNKEPDVENQNRVDVDAVGIPVDKSAEVVHANEGNIENLNCSPQNEVPRPSLMARNSTAVAFEWDDSIDNLSEGSPDSHNRLHLPSPKRRIVSPLKKYELKKISRRRKLRRWSLLEEDTLRTAVEEHGTGNWAQMLKSYPDVFEERTAVVDLKDKWRNLTRS